MDIMAVIGWILGIGLMVFGMVFNEETMSFVFGNMVRFINYPSLAITVGGTFAMLMVSYPGKMFAKMGKHLKIILFPVKYDPYKYIDEIVSFAKEARMKGLLSLEDKLNETKDPFLKSSLMLVVDSIEPEKVTQLLEAELDYLDDRHAYDRGFYDRGAVYAPAFGMIGTLIGLVHLLKQMDDPDAIGPAMAVALLTTLYGSFLANVLFLPISAKLKVRHDEEFLCKMLVCEGVQAIQAGENPKFIGEKLGLLVPKGKSKKGKDGGDGGDGGGDAGGDGDGGKKGKKKK